MSKRHYTLLYLYPYEMNTYGDWGNVQVLVQRAQARGVTLQVHEHRPGKVLPKKFDLIFMGGGQDSGQSLILEDLQAIGDKIRGAIEDNTPALVICGGYQLFGHVFYTADGGVLHGLGIFDLVTRASKERLIGNVHLQSDQFGEVIGFENHSGRTELGPEMTPFGKVKVGAGNNGDDGGEGIVFRNAIGTYLHGPLLPKNPQVADWLLAKMLGVSNTELVQLPDLFVAQARAQAKRRPR
ncbi:MAG: glutamine amidotransferase [Candidatus Saccharibacteria bacterium]